MAEGYAAMPIIPASHLEQLDPSIPLMRKLAEMKEYVDTADDPECTGDPSDSESGSSEDAGDTHRPPRKSRSADRGSQRSDPDGAKGMDLLGGFAKEVDALKRVLAAHVEEPGAPSAGRQPSPAESRERAQRLVLPTAVDRLANMFDGLTWHAAFAPLLCWGDCLPYTYRRGGDALQLSLRDWNAYLMQREELHYPAADGTLPPVVQPSRWSGADRVAAASFATERQVCAGCLLEREQQIHNVRAIVNAPGFAELQKHLLSVTPKQFIDAAGEGGKRTTGQVMRAPEVPEAIKKCLFYMTLASKDIVNTPAERQTQQLKAQALQAVYGAWVVFVTPNMDPLRSPCFAQLAAGPGEGPLARCAN